MCCFTTSKAMKPSASGDQRKTDRESHPRVYFKFHIIPIGAIRQHREETLPQIFPMQLRIKEKKKREHSIFPFKKIKIRLKNVALKCRFRNRRTFSRI
uniref:Uncharacterized protein n=1 Tax=Octopus bimaculoides TaxID=37653 RepID=A0A0L8HUW9_OCTBM